MASLRIEVFGGLAVRPEGGEPCALPAKKARALLAFLALPAGRPHSRERLTALLWGDTPDGLARQAFRQTLSRLRRALGEEAEALLVDGPETVALDAGKVWVDAGAFEVAVARAEPTELARAVELYRGDFLEGLDVGEPPFEEWHTVERERLRELALDALAKLLRHQMDAQASDAAVRTALRTLALDPLQEVVHRALMRLYLDQGRRAAALRQYQECIQLLEREMGAEPEELTRELYRKILRGAGDLQARPVPAGAARFPGYQPSVATRGRFVGRAPALDALEHALDRVLDSGGRVVVVSGEAGSGKTRLLDEFAGAAAARGIRIALGRCYETEQPLPFRPWLDALRGDGVSLSPDLRDAMSAQARASLVRLFPELGRPDERPATTADEHTVLFAALDELVQQLSEDAPLLIVLDDLQWADAMSARLLAYLGRRLGSAPVLVIGSMRSEEVPSPVLETALVELRATERMDEIALGALTRDESLELARALTTAGKDRVSIEAIADDLWTLSEGNPFVIVEIMRALNEGGDGRSPAIPRSVRQSVSARVARLSDAARRTVAAAAVVGRAASFGLLAHSAGLGETAVAAAVEELVRRRVLETVGDRLVIAHDRIRRVVYDDLVPAVRTSLHGAVARALELHHAGDLDEVTNELGHHFLVVGDAAKAIGYLERFADVAARRYALDAAIDARRQAMEAAEALAPAARDRSVLEVAFRQAFVFSLAGRHGDGLQLMQRHAPLLERVGDPALASDYSFRLAVATHYFGRYVDARQAAGAAIREAERAGDDQRLGRGLYALALVNLALGEASEALANATRAVSLLDTPATRHYLGLTYWLVTWSHTVLGHLEAALETGERFRALGASTGDRRLRAFAAYITALVHVAHGDSVAALQCAREAIDMAAEPVSASLACFALGVAHLEHGDFKRAIDAFNEVLTLRPAHLTRQRTLAYQADAHLGLDDLPSATLAAREALDGAIHDAAPFLGALAHRVLGRIAAVRGDHAGAADHLEQALDGFLSGEAEFEGALTRLELARVVADRGDPGAARTHLAEAVRAFAAAGAPRRVAQAQALARQLGIDPAS
jgi:DNA-binding SARP family transcriptional activator